MLDTDLFPPLSNSKILNRFSSPRLLAMKAGDLRSSVGLQAHSGDLDKMNLRDRDGVKMSRLLKW